MAARMTGCAAGCALLTLVISACGGGGGSSSDNAPLDNGSLLGGSLGPFAIEGLQYSTSTVQGTTDSNGGFTYREGETVTFQLADTRLGSAAGAASVSLLQLTGAAPLDQVREITAALHDPASEFAATANLIRLLHSLDSDLDPSNGIFIEDSTRTLFVNETTLTFDDVPHAFAASLPVRGIMTDLGRSLVDLEVALAGYFRAAGIELSINGARHARKLAEHVVALTPSAPVGSFRTENTYDTQGNLTYTASYDGNGTLQYSHRYHHDAFGYRLDAESDWNGDGQPDSLTDYRRDPSGFAIESYTVSGDNLAHRSRTTTTFNGRGLRTRMESDRGDDGTVDAFYQTRYLDNDLPVRAEADTDGDGLVDDVNTMTYDADHRLIRSTYEGTGLDTGTALEGRIPALGTGPFSDFDPTSAYPEASPTFGVVGSFGLKVQRVTDFLWDANGFLIRREAEIKGDETAKTTTTFTYENRRLVAWSYSRTGDRPAESTARYTYNEAGQLISVEQSTEQFSLSLEQRQLTYDARGRVVRIETTSNGFGANDGIRTFQYDDLGQVNEITFDGDADGQIDGRMETLWEASDRLEDWAGYN